ncbi:MAG: hypothetical protein RL379_568 [Bacillota bacterium]|jgi:hypothetical protein
MSFQAYITNIMAITKTTPEAIKNKGLKDGVLNADLTATIFCAWLAKDYKLGRGHAMALWKLFIEKGWIYQPKSKVLKKK